jgi:hypothetical protein
MKAISTIWKTVVFAGAMLAAAPGCKKSSNTESTTPTGNVGGDDTGGPGDWSDPCADPCGDPCADPCADPCGPRSRGGGDEPMGRGFILS